MNMKKSEYCTNDDEYEEFQEIADECERFFWYVKDHWDEYCKFCETHDPFEFPLN